MLGGIHGKILHVDLTTGHTRVEEPPETMYRLLVGGRALVAYLLLRDLAPNTDALSPDNLLIFAPGILQGTNLPGAGRHGVGGKSPLTGALASSEAGGWWGHEFKRSGFDALVIRGRAAAPCYIHIQDGNVTLRPAAHLWGLPTWPAQQRIQAELQDPRVRIAQIGPAGENGVLYSSVMHDINRAAGRNGLGALMGSKNLKAVAVRGTLKVPVVERAPVNNVAKWLGANYKTLAAWATNPGRGTQDSLAWWANVGALPTNNFGTPVFADAAALSGERNYEMFHKERDTCQSCPITCKQVFEHASDNPYQKLNPEYGGPEYEAMAALGSNCGITDNLAVAKANELCNANGLDAISTGASIGFAMECFENGIITEHETGQPFRWGDAGLLVHAVESIAARSGFGAVLATGVQRMSQRFGPASAAFALTVKGQELPMHEPRLKHALGLGYAVAPVGADHMMNMHDTDFAYEGEGLKRVNSALTGRTIGALRTSDLGEDKLQVFHHELNWMHFQDCAVNCHFYPYSYAHLAEALSGVTGSHYGIADVLAVGARAQTLARLFNLREGFSADDDRLPRRVMRAFKSGPLQGVEISEESFNWARRRYYELLGWDGESGVPASSCLASLQLPELGLQL